MDAKKILMVDDDDLVQIAVSELLRTRGYDVTTASSGFDALKILADQRFDLFLLDVIMPGMSGLELCYKIREMDELVDVPVIMLTAKSADEDRRAGMDAGANVFLPKPISPDRLLQLVDQVLKG